MFNKSICLSISLPTLLLAFSSLYCSAEVVEDTWFKVLLVEKGHEGGVHVGHVRLQKVTVDTADGVLHEASGEMKFTTSDSGVPTETVSRFKSVCNAAGHIISEEVKELVNGSLVSRFEVHISDGTMSFSRESLQDGKKAGERALPGPLMNTEALQEELFEKTDTEGGQVTLYTTPGDGEDLENAPLEITLTYLGVSNQNVNGRTVPLKGYQLKQGNDTWRTYVDLDNKTQLTVLDIPETEGVQFRVVRASKEEATEIRTALDDWRLVDAMNLLTSHYYTVTATQRFDYVDSSVLNNFQYAEFPVELVEMARNLKRLCKQGRIAMEEENLVDDAHTRRQNMIAMRFGAKACRALAMEDPVSLVFGAAGAVNELGSANEERKRQMAKVYRQYENALSNYIFDLRKLQDKLQKEYDLPGNTLISFEALDRMHEASQIEDAGQRLSKLRLLGEKFPYYAPLHKAIASNLFYAEGQFDDEEFLRELGIAYDYRNTLLKVDPTAVNALQLAGTFFCLKAWHADPSVHAECAEMLYALAQQGMALDKSIPEFYLFRGVAGVLKAPYEVSEQPVQDLLDSSSAVDDLYLQQMRWLWTAVYMGCNNEPFSDEHYAKALEQLFSLGYADIKGFVRSAGLERTMARTQVLASAVEVKWSWSVTSDFWSKNDIKLKNESAFPLTNVRLKGTLKEEGRTERFEVSCGHIPAGKIHTWKNEVRISGDEGKAVLECDQELDRH